MSLSCLQTCLQSVYELDIEHNIDDYLTTSRSLAGGFGNDRSSIHAREKLFVHEDEHGLNLSLYIDEGVLNCFNSGDPFAQLDESNIEEFCLVLEGASHFTYLVWNATHDRPVTLLELELQAEVDKYITLMHCIEQQENLAEYRQLIRLLFEANSYHPDLDQEELKRYRAATAYAHKYCLQLETRFGGLRDRNGLLAELRRFYRLGLRDKVRRIQQPH